MYGSLEDVRPADTGIVFGAYVFEDGRLSDAAPERVKAAALPYNQGKVSSLLISGDERTNGQASEMALATERLGVPHDAIVIDPVGIDTHDTCRHADKASAEAILVTQSFHLPRAMLMCQHEGLQVTGLAANRLGPLPVRGANRIAVASTRLARFARESLLTWSSLLGLYERLSREAEDLERPITG